MSRPFRLLISARDTGAANNLAPLARLAQASSNFTLHLVAAEPAARLFAGHGLEPEKVSAPDDRLPTVAARLLEQHQPDAVLVGLSGPGRGIDEALLAAARGRVPSWALQDFWGDVNNGFGAYADTYLVRDNTAARITRERAAVHTRVCRGLPGNAEPPEAWQQQRMARRLRQRHHVEWKTPLVVLCSQPLWQQPGYQETLRDLLLALPPSRLLVRMHPRESTSDRNRMRKLLRSYSPVAWSFSDDQFVALLSAADLLTSPFSNSGLDKALFNSRSRRTGGTPVFALHQPRLQKLYKDWTGLNTHPLSATQASITLARKGTLKTDLSKALDPTYQAKVLRAARNLRPKSNTSLEILDLIRHDHSKSNLTTPESHTLDARQAS